MIIVVGMFGFGARPVVRLAQTIALFDRLT